MKSPPLSSMCLGRCGPGALSIASMTYDKLLLGQIQTIQGQGLGQSSQLLARRRPQACP